LFHAAARELASSGIDLDGVPVPRIEEIFEPGTFTRPMPNRPRSPASVAERFSGPTAATPSAVLRPPAMAVPYAAAGIYPLAHPVHTTRNPRNAAVIWL
jgi:hypothetical protein